MTFNSIDLTTYLKGISISGRGLEQEREVEEIPGADPLEVSKVDKLNRITVKASIIGANHAAYRSSVASWQGQCKFSKSYSAMQRVIDFADLSEVFR